MTLAISDGMVARADAIPVRPREYSDAVYGVSLPVWQTRMIVFSPLVGATLLAKFGIPPLASSGIGLLYPLVFGMLAYGFITTQLQFESRRLAAFFLMLSTLGTMQVLRTDSFSMPSFMLMAVMACTFVFTARTPAVTRDEALSYFCNLTALIAVFGIVQFSIQFLGNLVLAFPIDLLLPDGFRTLGYNHMAPLEYNSPVFKSTGFVMLEPSYFSQLCAIGLVAELYGRSRLLRLAAYVVAMLVAYSGTGILILAVALPVYVIAHRRWDFLIRGAVLGLLILALSEPLNINMLGDRLDEFNSVGSSGFARFVGWMDLFSDRLWPSTSSALFGNGAGSFESMSVGYSVAQMAHAKILFEFGIVGGLIYFGFLLFCLFGNSAPRAVQVAILACYFMNGAYATISFGLALSVLLWPNQSTGGTERAGAAAPGKLS
jgi:hypothetical protein